MNRYLKAKASAPPRLARAALAAAPTDGPWRRQQHARERERGEIEEAARIKRSKRMCGHMLRSFEILRGGASLQKAASVSA
jgi:hypothetical protein